MPISVPGHGDHSFRFIIKGMSEKVYTLLRKRCDWALVAKMAWLENEKTFAAKLDLAPRVTVLGGPSE
jgi:hypothetical protein